MITLLIALDDGHGMDTPGKRTPFISEIGRYIPENEFNRAVVKYLDEELSRCGFRTLLVAPTDADTSLKSRTDLANSKGAAAYISIHYDAIDGKFDGEGKDAEGISVFYQTGSANGKKLADSIYKYLKEGTPQKSRGVKPNNFHVTRETKMVAILSENGFMDNKKEALRMIDTSFQKEVAREHAQGICEYFGVRYIGENNDPTVPLWDGVEIKKGQIGRLTILKPINLWRREVKDKRLKLSEIRVLKIEEVHPVYGFDDEGFGGQYDLGANTWVTNMNGYVKYETPSASKRIEMGKYFNK